MGLAFLPDWLQWILGIVIAVGAASSLFDRFTWSALGLLALGVAWTIFGIYSACEKFRSHDRHHKRAP